MKLSIDIFPFVKENSNEKLFFVIFASQIQKSREKMKQKKNASSQ